MARLFTWPGISKDTKAWCRSCPECQKAAKKTSHLAPLCPLPVISTPFSRVAFDLVGPLPKSKSGNRYILTCMCLASKYPEAVALCRGVHLHVCALHLNTLRQLHYAGGILTCMCLASRYPEAVALCRGYTYMYVPCI